MSPATRVQAPLVAHTVALDQPPRLVDHLPDGVGFVWLHGDDGLVGWGEAARVDPGVGEGRFSRAADMLAERFAACELDDEVGVPGSGPVAFGALTFDWRSGGSALVVPRVLVGRRGGRAWRTTITAGRASATGLPGG
ncbi:MAG: isochorismate synthase, partial [Actinomycetota bacterium]|nr:isochorismate synthase [Actinomycetota bacterium]